MTVTISQMIIVPIAVAHRGPPVGVGGQHTARSWSWWWWSSLVMSTGQAGQTVVEAVHHVVGDLAHATLRHHAGGDQSW